MSSKTKTYRKKVFFKFVYGFTGYEGLLPLPSVLSVDLVTDKMSVIRHFNDQPFVPNLVIHSI